MKLYHARVVTPIPNESDKTAKALATGPASKLVAAKGGAVRFSRGFGTQPAMLIVGLPDELDPATFYPELAFADVTPAPEEPETPPKPKGSK